MYNAAVADIHGHMCDLLLGLGRCLPAEEQKVSRPQIALAFPWNETVKRNLDAFLDLL